MLMEEERTWKEKNVRMADNIDLVAELATFPNLLYAVLANYEEGERTLSDRVLYDALYAIAQYAERIAKEVAERL